MRFVPKIFSHDCSLSYSHVLLTVPLDGSSNIDVDVALGTVFSICHHLSPIGTPVTKANFLQPDNRQVVAGHIVYSSSTMLVCTIGNGVYSFTYDRSVGIFGLSQELTKIPEDGDIYSINESQYLRFPAGAKKYLKYCQEEETKTNRPYKSRYIGALISDYHRNMIKGGYLYLSFGDQLP